MEKELSIRHNPSRCRHLQSKGMYLNAHLPPGENIVGDGYFWCGKTQAGFGPDNELCGGEECTQDGRGCFVTL